MYKRPHVRGSKRYVTGDDSRNNWLLAFFTMGEGWHNNHHAFQSSARQGFRWWEADATYYILRALSWLGIVWDLKTPPERVLRNSNGSGRGSSLEPPSNWRHITTLRGLPLPLHRA